MSAGPAPSAEAWAAINRIDEGEPELIALVGLLLRAGSARPPLVTYRCRFRGCRLLTVWATPDGAVASWVRHHAFYPKPPPGGDPNPLPRSRARAALVTDLVAAALYEPLDHSVGCDHIRVVHLQVDRLTGDVRRALAAGREVTRFLSDTSRESGIMVRSAVQNQRDLRRGMLMSGHPESE